MTGNFRERIGCIFRDFLFLCFLMLCLVSLSFAVDTTSLGGSEGGHRAQGTALKGRDYNKAVRDRTKAIEINPNDAVAYNRRGNIFRAKRDYDKAITDYSKAIEINPQYVLAYNNRGTVFRKKGDYDKAIADYGKAIEIDPKYALAYYHRGIVFGEKGDYDGAIADYSKAIDLDPKFFFAYNNRADALHLNGDYERAIADYNKIIERDPKDEYSRISLFLVLREFSSQRFQSYRNEFRQYITTHDSGEWVRTISKYLLGMDGLTEDKVLSEAGHGKDDQQVRQRLCEAYYYLGEERLLKGNTKGAEEFFQKSVQTNLIGFREFRFSKQMLKSMGEGKV